ncbi:MAG: EAL domain-containing protein [Rubrivivax sp.]|nr:EAL domain-containing protein [Rubrivivax sp.]
MTLEDRHSTPGGLLRRFHAAYLHDYNRAAEAYWWVMVLLGAAFVAAAALELMRDPGPVALQVAAGVACAALAALAPIRIPRTKNSFAVGEIFIFLLLMLHGPAAAVLAAAVEAAVATLRTSKRLSSRLASPALAAVSMTLAGTAYANITALAAAWGVASPGLTLAALLLVALGGSVLNLVLQTAIFALKARRAPLLRENLAGFGWMGIVNCASAAVSGLLFYSFQQIGPGVLLIAVPIIVGLLAALHMYFRLADLDEQSRRARVEAAEREAAQTARHLAELQRSEQRFQSAFSHAAIGMALVGSDDGLLQCNHALLELLGADGASLAGRPVYSLLDQEAAQELRLLMAAVRSSAQRSFNLTARSRHGQDGSTLHLTIDGSMFDDEVKDQPCLILQIQDVTARVLAERRLEHIAYHDGLTHLPNRGRFLAELEQRLDASRAAGQGACAVLFLDFDRFKLINDSLGHNVGDGFLREVAARLRASVPEPGLVARLGGDEFAVLLWDVRSAADVEALAGRMQAAIRAPMIVDGHELHTSASIGIRLSDEATPSPQVMLRDADTAMYRAKAAGKARHCLFDAGMHAELVAQLELESDLRVALNGDDIEIALQPLVHLASGEICAYEAFARWRHPRLGPLPAERFVRLAEESGMIRLLGQRILERACEAIQRLSRADGQAHVLHVNVSSLDLCHNGFAARLAELLWRCGMQPGQMWLEITERSVAGHLDAMAQTLHDLRELGVGLCLDDFGTGHSSLRHLSTLPIRRLKVDGTLLRDSQEQTHGEAVLRAVVQLGRALGLEVVAEGVETESQVRLVRELGCVIAQGYHFGRPLPAEHWAQQLSADRTNSLTGDALQLSAA